MPEESATPDLVELTRGMLEAFARGDFDAILSGFAADGVWDMSPLGMGTFEGHVAIRDLWEDWFGAYEEYESDLEECQDLGNGVVLAAVRQDARPAGSAGRVQHRPVFISEWVDGMVVQVTAYYDIEEARAAAERFAEERG
jgi:ketosteroid isomerase-like protein